MFQAPWHLPQRSATDATALGSRRGGRIRVALAQRRLAASQRGKAGGLEVLPEAQLKRSWAGRGLGLSIWVSRASGGQASGSSP